MASYTKKVRKPIRSALIRLLARVDDPKVQIMDGQVDIRTDPEPHYGDGGFITYSRTGVITYTLHLTLFDPSAADKPAALEEDA